MIRWTVKDQELTLCSYRHAQKGPMLRTMKTYVEGVAMGPKVSSDLIIHLLLFSDLTGLKYLYLSTHIVLLLFFSERQIPELVFSH